MTIIEQPELLLGDYIRKARRSTGLNQTDFGKKVGVTQTRVSNWERGEEYPDVMQMREIANLSGHEYLLDLRFLPSRWTDELLVAA